jgi:hypothetical protein
VEEIRRFLKINIAINTTQSQTQNKPKTIMYSTFFIPFSASCILLVAREIGPTHEGSIFSPVENLLIKRVFGRKKRKSLDTYTVFLDLKDDIY